MTCTSFGTRSTATSTASWRLNATAAADRIVRTAAACDRLAGPWPSQVGRQADVSDGGGPASLEVRGRRRRGPGRGGITRAGSGSAPVVASRRRLLLLAVCWWCARGQSRPTPRMRWTVWPCGSMAAARWSCEGTLLCRDCELEHRYGIQAPCKTSAITAPLRRPTAASGTWSSSRRQAT